MSHEQSIPPMIRQGQIVQAIGEQATARVTGSWVRAWYRASVLVSEADLELVVERPDGRLESALPPRNLFELVRELRDVMYTPGVGTWYSMEVTVEFEGAATATFDYENEPRSGSAPAAGAYRLDFERYPRDDTHVPEWLRAHLDESS